MGTNAVEKEGRTKYEEACIILRVFIMKTLKVLKEKYCTSSEYK